MIVFFKNFQRTERVLLSIQSVRHLFPEIEINCLNLYLENPSEYDNFIPVFKKLNVKLFFDVKKYNFESFAGGSMNNGYYFTEGINKMFNLVSFGKVLMLDEDSFFTTGETIRFLMENEFDLAYGTWPSPTPNGFEQINGSIICFNTETTKNLFPIPEYREYIENLLGKEIYGKGLNLALKMVKIPTRTYIDYGNDGTHTNDIETIKEKLKEANIPFTI